MAFQQTTPPIPAANLWREVDNRAPGSYDGWSGTILVMYLHFVAHARDNLIRTGRKLIHFFKSMKGKLGKLGCFVEGIAGKIKGIITKVKGMVGKVKDLFRKVEGVIWDEEIDDIEEGMGED